MKHKHAKATGHTIGLKSVRTRQHDQVHAIYDYCLIWFKNYIRIAISR
ncbi:hypothetical Protein YC6258_05638 [Gynuella sunshinyii YC6258]|uniref:Uncharacterized protein n=1 Tax=Gynuella sunshinyii YC6258 TaxID=1445510 RepID=A0A0C5VU12_9GAMM|nr:hypothetical Protein YC6258_05638 [Gynuella sunshinyii YC6258]